MAEIETRPSVARSNTTEQTPLLSEAPRPRAARTVTFNANPVSRTIEPERLPEYHRPRSSRRDSFPSSPGGSTAVGIAGPPMLTALNNKLRRRSSGQGHSQGHHSSHGHGTGGSHQFNTAGSTVPSGAAGLAASPTAANHGPKIGPQRSTKNAQKLKLLPNPDFGEDGPDEESGRDVYSQYTRIKDPTARRDAARLGKADRDRLPRVTAYCTANKYQMESLMRFLKGRGKTKGANPKLIDECIYTPYSYGKSVEARRPAKPAVRRAGGYGSTESMQQRRYSTGDISRDTAAAFLGGGDEAVGTGDSTEATSGGGEEGDRQAERHDSGFSDGYDTPTTPTTPTAAPHHDEGGGYDDDGLIRSRDLLGPGVGDESAVVADNPDFDTQVHTPEVFLFDYGVVVIWGMSRAHEERFLKEIAKFETEKLAPDDVETEYFNFYYTREYQERIYNDFITLRDKHNYMTKLAISHALAQSVKTSLFEELIASTIETCKDIPTQIALTGKIALSRTQINMQVGELFILRINIHLNGSVLDTPELFWVEPQLEPVYQAVRSYLEMDQRVGLLTERLDVIADLLAVLKDQLSHGHGEKLEWIVIILIAAEILVAAVNIVVDLYAAD